jgi:hypothetical protein
MSPKERKTAESFQFFYFFQLKGNGLSSVKVQNRSVFIILVKVKKKKDILHTSLYLEESLILAFCFNGLIKEEKSYSTKKVFDLYFFTRESASERQEKIYLRINSPLPFFPHQITYQNMIGLITLLSSSQKILRE